MTKQRVSQIERKMILRATAHALKGASAARPSATAIIRNTPTTWIRTITREEFKVAWLASIRISTTTVQQNHRARLQAPTTTPAARVRQRSAPSSAEYGLHVEAYGKRPFSFSRLLIADFPATVPPSPTSRSFSAGSEEPVCCKKSAWSRPWAITIPKC